MTCRILLYSFSDRALTVGEGLAWELGAQLHTIDTPAPEPGIWSALKSGIYGLLSRGTPVDVPDQPWHRSDLLILGTPVWGGRVSRPMRQFLATHPELPERVAFLVTSSDGAYPKAVVEEMSKLCGQEPVAVLHVCDQQVNDGSWHRRMEQFLDLCVLRYRQSA